MKKLFCLFAVFALAIVLMFANVSKADLVTNGLVAYWSLNADSIVGTDVEDVIGGNNGVLVGSPVPVAGKVKGALEFDGASSVDITGTDSLNFNGKSEMTVSAWVKAASDEPVKGVVAGCCGSVVAQRDANGWAMRFDGRNAGAEMELIVCPGWQGDSGFGAPKFNAGEWHYLTGVVNVDKVLLYVDGELVKEEAFTGPMSSNGPETEIGKASDGGFVGTIDEVTIYNRALSADEIKQNFKAEGLNLAAVSGKDKITDTWGHIKSK